MHNNSNSNSKKKSALVGRIILVKVRSQNGLARPVEEVVFHPIYECEMESNLRAEEGSISLCSSSFLQRNAVLIDTKD
jgi:hypothetical protein